MFTNILGHSKADLPENSSQPLEIITSDGKFQRILSETTLLLLIPEGLNKRGIFLLKPSSHDIPNDNKGKAQLKQ